MSHLFDLFRVKHSKNKQWEDKLRKVDERLKRLEQRLECGSRLPEPPVVVERLYVEQLKVEKVELNNNIGALGVKEISGMLNIGATYGVDLPPRGKPEFGQPCGQAPGGTQDGACQTGDACSPGAGADRQAGRAGEAQSGRPGTPRGADKPEPGSPDRAGGGHAQCAPDGSGYRTSAGAAGTAAGGGTRSRTDGPRCRIRPRKP